MLCLSPLFQFLTEHKTSKRALAYEVVATITTEAPSDASLEELQASAEESVTNALTTSTSPLAVLLDNAGANVYETSANVTTVNSSPSPSPNPTPSTTATAGNQDSSSSSTIISMALAFIMITVALVL